MKITIELGDDKLLASNIVNQAGQNNTDPQTFTRVRMFRLLHDALCDGLELDRSKGSLDPTDITVTPNPMHKAVLDDVCGLLFPGEGIDVKQTEGGLVYKMKPSSDESKPFQPEHPDTGESK